jgi:hypothetical protein
MDKEAIGFTLREKAEKVLEADIELNAIQEIKEKLCTIKDYKFDIKILEGKISEREAEILAIESNLKRFFLYKV